MKSYFAHLGVHTEYSIRDSVIRVNHLMSSAVEKNISAIAIVDYMNLYAMVKFYRKAINSGIKPIIGMDCLVHTPCGNGVVRLLSKNNQGFYHLKTLASLPKPDSPYLSLEELKAHAEGLVVVLGGANTYFGRLLVEKYNYAATYIAQFSEIFHDDLYISVQRIQRPNEKTHLLLSLKFATEQNLVAIVAQDVVFLEKAQYEAHEARICIQSGEILDDVQREKLYTPEQYLKSAQEMQDLFQDFPTLLDNALILAQSCTVEIDLDCILLPSYRFAGADIKKSFKEKIDEGIAFRFKEGWSEAYQARLKHEYEVISHMRYESYFMIVQDFVHWAQQKGIPVGPGRGSGCGSLIAYLFGITDVDPLVYDLIFERFLNKERQSLPDLDIDFCIQNRDRVIDYIIHRYSEDCAAQIITFGHMNARAVIHDVGRVLGYPTMTRNEIAKMIPFKVGMTLQQALKTEADLAYRFEQDEAVKRLINIALNLEGLVRNTGRHAGGVVISGDRPLMNFTPLQTLDDKAQVTQLDKDDLSDVGLVKFDCLGLANLTAINYALTFIRDYYHKSLSLKTIDLKDKKTYKLLSQCHTVGVFQLESLGVRQLLKKIQPHVFEDIVAITALYRPGPMQSGMVGDFIKNRKDLKEQKTNQDFFDAKDFKQHAEALNHILEQTYGVIIYQEQVMKIAEIAAQYTMGEADLLRSAMGKKKLSEMNIQKNSFISRSEANGIPASVAMGLFDKLEKFAGYAFNRSHAVAYSLIAYYTAYLKTHYPVSFMASVFSVDMHDIDKIDAFFCECRRIGISLVPPDINKSHHIFTPHLKFGDGISFGLGGIKSLGRPIIEMIVEERDKNGPYESLSSFFSRISTYTHYDKINKKTLEALVYSGCLDALEKEKNRHILFEYACYYRDFFKEDSHNFQLYEPEPPVLKIDLKSFPYLDEIYQEGEYLGCYLTHHPVTNYQALLKDCQYKSKMYYIKGWKKGKYDILFSLENQSFFLLVKIEEKLFQHYQPYLRVGDVCFFDINRDKIEKIGFMKFCIALENESVVDFLHALYQDSSSTLFVEFSVLKEKFLMRLKARLCHLSERAYVVPYFISLEERYPSG